MNDEPTSQGTYASKKLSIDVYNQLCVILKEKAGLNLGPDKHVLVSNRVIARMREIGKKSVHDYISMIINRGPVEKAELNDLIIDLTIGETYLFREPHQFWALQTEVLPRIFRQARAKGRKTINIWSAGCSTGEEVFSLSITAQRVLMDDNSDLEVKIIGSDINTKSLAIAKISTISGGRFDRTPLDFKAVASLYFDKNASGYKINSDIMKRVKFSVHDLTRNDFIEQQDIIFCRNVILYFIPELRKKVIDKFHNSLLPGGYLFTAKTDAPVAYYNDFEQIVNREAIFYRKAL
jgi:chemotaxis protein methyltransferase CheR